ncbi:M24 family metallopeptidase [Planotetraspora silvatica]|nr:M24 family metallopeptidase [Planotetraspora silvatica]
MSTRPSLLSRGVGTPPPDFSDAEMARRRATIEELAARHELDAVIAYGANKFGNAVPWLTGWPVTREAVAVLRPGAPPALLVSFPNHVPNARRLATGCEVAPIVERTPDTVLSTLGTVRRVGTIGPVPVSLRTALDGVAAVVELDGEYGRLRARKSDEEMAWLRHAAALTDLSAAALVSAAVPGATELDLVAAVESAYAAIGGVNHIHYVAATSMESPDRCAPGQWPTSRLLESGSVVVFELSTTWGPDYPGQVLRTVTVDAEPTPLYRELHDVADAALAAMSGLLRPGALPLELRKAADLVLDAGFTTVDDLVHGLGGGYLPPVLSHRSEPSGRDLLPLEEGMTVVVQPNVCTTDLRAGVQTGEMFEITADGARSLHHFPTGLLRADTF